MNKRVSAPVLLLVSALAFAAPAKTTRMGFVVPSGQVTFEVGADWPVVGMQPKLPKAAAAYQIPNPADADTEDSTNLAVSLYDGSSDGARTAKAGLAARRKEDGVKRKKRADWEILSYSGTQGSTEYQIRDAYRTLGGYLVMVRLAWPRLPGNAKNYDAVMGKTFLSVIDSVALDR